MTQPFTVSGPNRNFEIDPYQQSYLSPDRNQMITTGMYESPTKTGIETIDVGFDDPAFANALQAKVTKQDLARYTPRYQKDLIDAQDYQSALETGTINPEMTEFEFNKMKEGKITQPGTYTPEDFA